ncbi:alpha/beta hydrolase [Clostridium sp. DSM 100503]|uniref:alpha/beta hydrolase n=1 Tax=Clostridium sp. DSM 100503 TaxID=2963282 RepID=UPI002149ACC4|nr:alpha/beta hydrolase [Clostridium sp. DSM 100503]MCR1949765.1 alpha/beta hydrolase [Clostridium sp. DSM 100503]
MRGNVKDSIIKYTYDDMPKVTNYPRRTKVIKGDKKNVRAFIGKDIVYCEKDGMELKLRFIYPEQLKENEKYPLFLHVQGSAWMKQDLNEHVLDFKDIVTSGYVLAIVEYRPSNVALFPGQVLDTKCAMRYIQKHSNELNIDINNVFISGDSSGGHTASLCWATWNNYKIDYTNELLCDVRGFINLYGVSNLATMNKYCSAFDHERNSPATDIIGVDCLSDNLDLALQASPIFYINDYSNDDPLLIIHGNKDRVVPFEQSIELYEKCSSHNKNVDFYCVDDADHGGSLFYCKDTIDIIISFLRKYTNK